MNVRGAELSAEQREARALSRLAQLRLGKLVHRDVLWPGSDMSVKLQVITCSETQECYAAAFERFERMKIPVNGFTAEAFNDEIATQLLYRACRQADKPEQPFALDPEDIRDHTTVDERAAMMVRYRDYAAEIDPDPTQMSADDVRAILDAVKKKDATTLRAFGSSILASFILTTAAPPATSPTGR